MPTGIGIWFVVANLGWRTSLPQPDSDPYKSLQANKKAASQDSPHIFPADPG